MTGEETRSLLDQVEARFEQEGNLIRLESGRAIFVGDTHGDLEATRAVIARHLNLKTQIVSWVTTLIGAQSRRKT